MIATRHPFFVPFLSLSISLLPFLALSKSFVCHSYKIFHSPYPLTPVFATLTKTCRVSINSSQKGTL
jgi:hypothetical protein